jgi:FHA domain-containing protein
MEARSPLDSPTVDLELVVLRPDGGLLRRVPLPGARVTVGRLPDRNDVALEPDPELLVGRVEHCALEKDGGHWFVIDGGSVNGTFVRRGGVVERVEHRHELHGGDAVCILGSVTPTGERRYFELLLQPADGATATRAAPTPSSAVPTGPGCVRYEAEAGRLVLARGTHSQEIPLRPQTHRLVAFMAERNASAGTPVLCTHDELIEAVWSGEPLHTRLELARLFWELRRELRQFGAEQLVEGERRRGYRLRTCA